jgi:hypothetical protein
MCLRVSASQSAQGGLGVRPEAVSFRSLPARVGCPSDIGRGVVNSRSASSGLGATSG